MVTFLILHITGQVTVMRLSALSELCSGLKRDKIHTFPKESYVRE